MSQPVKRETPPWADYRPTLREKATEEIGHLLAKVPAEVADHLDNVAPDWRALCLADRMRVIAEEEA